MTLAARAALLVSLIGFGWRSRELGTQSFWWDEAYSAVVARGSLSEIVAAITAADFHPPLHYFLFHYWRLVAGESEYTLRYTAVWAGTASIALAFATGRRLFGARAGLTAALLFATSPYLVYYSTEARMFALAALLALLALYLAQRGAWPEFTLALVVGIYNFYYGLLILAPIALFAGRGWWRMGAAAAVAALLYAPWVPIALTRTVEWTSPWTAPTTPQRVLAWTWPALLTGIPAVELWNHPRLWPVLAAVAALLAVFVVAAPVVCAGPRYARGLWLAAVAAALPLALMAAIALARPIYHPRYAMPAAPALYLALAGAIALPVRWLLPLRAALALCVAISFGYGLYRYYDGGGVARDDYRSAIAFVSAAERPGDAAISNVPPGFLYYYRGGMPHRELPSGLYEDSTIISQLNEAAAGRQRLWYVTHDLRPSDPEGFVDLQLEHRARRIEERRFGHVRVRLYGLVVPFEALPFRSALAPTTVGDQLTLLGIGLDDRPTLAGAELPLTLRWWVERTPPVDLGVWARLRDEDGFAWGREDRRPRNSAFLLASGWTAGGELTTRHGVPIAPGTPPGRYRLEVGVYRLDDLRGLEVRSGGVPIGQDMSWPDVVIAANPAVGEDPKLGGAAGPIDDAVSLVGSGIGQAEAPAGANVDLTLLWRAQQPPGPRDLVLRLLGADGARVAERRGAPTNGRHPVERWQAGELVRDQTRFPLPPTLATGTYRLWAGLAQPGREPVGVELGALRVSSVARQTVMPPIANPLSVRFGDGVDLAGWELTHQEPGRARLTLFWRPSGTPTREYRVFNHVLDRVDKIVSQRDGVPVGWSRPTTGWVAGEAIVDPYDLELPASDGPLRIRIGVYEPVLGARLIASGKDHVDLTEIAP